MSARRRIVLWRHGRTAWNVSGRFQGQLDSELEPSGLADIAAAASVLAALPPARLLVSSSGRARASAAYLEELTGLQGDVTPELQEIFLGAWQGLTWDEAAERFPEEYAAWRDGADVARGGGETYAEVGERASRVLLSAVSELPAEGVLVAVTHGGTARAATGALLTLPPDTWWRLAPLGNARWAVLVEGDRGWRLGEHNAGITEPVDRSRITAPDVDFDADAGTGEHAAESAAGAGAGAGADAGLAASADI